jgi:hypothetical protein
MLTYASTFSAVFFPLVRARICRCSAFLAVLYRRLLACFVARTAAYRFISVVLAYAVLVCRCIAFSRQTLRSAIARVRITCQQRALPDMAGRRHDYRLDCHIVYSSGSHAPLIIAGSVHRVLRIA